MKIAKKLAVAACVASAFTMMNTQAEETKAPVSVSQAGTALPAGNLRYGLTNHRRRIFLTISFQAKLGNVINTLLCTNIRHG